MTVARLPGACERCGTRVYWVADAWLEGPTAQWSRHFPCHWGTGVRGTMEAEKSGARAAQTAGHRDRQPLGDCR